MNLQNWTSQAKAHWKQHQPEKFRQLADAGMLEAALQHAAEQTLLETSQLEAAGFQPDEAFQMVRENYLFPPETAPAKSPSMSHRMVAAARSGQRSMPIG